MLSRSLLSLSGALACLVLLSHNGTARANGSFGSLGVLTAGSLDRSGTVDVTAGLQRLISQAYRDNLVLMLPLGRYLVSDTLWVNQSNWAGGDGGINIVPDRFRPNVIIGSTLGPRPTIVLAASAAGFDDPSSPKNLMKVTNPLNENINMNQIVRNINFEIGPGNPGAIALFFHGAQGATVQVQLAPPHPRY